MPGRIWDGIGYRFGFNGKENDNEAKGTANEQDYGMRIYDPRLGRFLSVDPIRKEYPNLTPYQFASNRVVDGIDLDGKERLPYYERLPSGNVKQGTANFLYNVVVGAYNGVAFTWNKIVDYGEAFDSPDPIGGIGAQLGRDWQSISQIPGNLFEGAKQISIADIKNPENYWRAAENFVILYAPFANKLNKENYILRNTSAAKALPSTDEIFSLAIKNRGALERYALSLEKYKRFINLNDYFINNVGYDLISTFERRIVDVTSTAAANLKPSNFYKKIRALNDFAIINKSKATLQIFVKEGQYSEEQLGQLINKLNDYIEKAEFKETVDVAVDVVKK